MAGLHTRRRSRPHGGVGVGVLIDANNVPQQVVGVMGGEDRAAAPHINGAVLEDDGCLKAELA